ncbi:ATP-dependent DNA helicase PIF1 [Paramuricea clavata]|uniref:ATP-dependent DNA helicase PIF1 n=1 Tax=Paramuricea clavata TaxID=317549 RepID=A0A6S7I4J9_PARCT|nr:ATP-dependent DNA helicase PIF1 [Paramuricea clavata]
MSASQHYVQILPETNPGPVFYIDPSKTISAPYSQGNQIIFGETAGQQCLAMCLCALIYNKRQNICSPQDLVNVMNIGNELYSNLSCLARQSFLLFTELPSQLTVFDTDYIFEYSESYSGNVIGDCSIEGYQYCVPFHRSFELLLAENYSAFILTIDSNAVCIFSTTDGKYIVFDSHSRDIYGRSHPQGACVLLEAPNINNVILYFQSLYGENSQFELRGINIEEVQANCDQNLNNSIRNSALSAYDDDDSSPTCTAHYIKNIKDKYTLVDTIFKLVTTKIEDENVNYEIQFLSCASELSNCESVKEKGL